MAAELSKSESPCAASLSRSAILADANVRSSKTLSSAVFAPPTPPSSHHAVVPPASATLFVANEMRNHHYRPRDRDLLSGTLVWAPSSADEEEDDTYATRRTRSHMMPSVTRVRRTHEWIQCRPEREPR
jgi:hypothetical protein